MLCVYEHPQVALGDGRRLSVMGAAAASGHIQIMRYLTFTQVIRRVWDRTRHAELALSG